MLRYTMIVIFATATPVLSAVAQVTAQTTTRPTGAQTATRPTDAQSTTRPTVPAERGMYVTAFRSPATGLEIRNGHFAANAGFYPTILSRSGQRTNVNFVRAGASYYLKPRGNTVYVSPALLWSLDNDWRSGAITEVGFRGSVYRRVYGRLGAAVLTSFDGEVRVNPTVGLDIRVGKLVNTGAAR